MSIRSSIFAAATAMVASVAVFGSAAIAEPFAWLTITPSAGKSIPPPTSSRNW